MNPHGHTLRRSARHTPRVFATYIRMNDIAHDRGVIELTEAVEFIDQVMSAYAH